MFPANTKKSFSHFFFLIFLFFVWALYKMVRLTKNNKNNTNATKRGILRLLSATAKYIKFNIESAYKKLVKKE